MAAFLWWALVSAPAVAAGYAAFAHLGAETSPFLNPIMEGCSEATADIPNPLLKFFRFFNCFITPFFREIVRTKEGGLIWFNFCSVGAAFGAIMAVESSRSGARPPLSWHGIYTLIFMFIGVSVALPSLWLPAYFAVGLPAKDSASALKCKLSWHRVLALGFFNAVFFITGVAVLATLPDTLLDLAIQAAVWVPIAAPFLWSLVRTTKASNQSAGHTAVNYLFSFTAGLCFTCHVGTLLFLASNPSVVFGLRDNFYSHEGAAATIYFLAVDLALFVLALVYQILVDDGPLTALIVLLSFPAIGPTSLCFYYMSRESRIAALAAQGAVAPRSKKTK